MNSPNLYKAAKQNKAELTNFPTQESEYRSPKSFIPLLCFSTQTSFQITHGHEVSNIMKMGGGLFVLTMGSLSILTVPEQYLGMQRNTVNRETLCRTKFQEIYQPLYLSLWHIAQPSLSSGVFLLTMDTQLARLLCSFSCISKAISDSPVK